jgi:hypothetical protein
VETPSSLLGACHQGWVSISGGSGGGGGGSKKLTRQSLASRMPCRPKLRANPDAIRRQARFLCRPRGPSVSGMESTHGQSVTRARGFVARWHVPTVFAAVVIAFCFPFATVSCDSAATTFTGVQLVTHTVPHGGKISNDDDSGASDISDRVEGQSSFTATLVLLVALTGVALGVARKRRTGWCALVGLVLTLVLGANTDLAEVTYRWGYWSTLLLFVWACLVHLGRASRRRWSSLPPPSVRQLG